MTCNCNELQNKFDLLREAIEKAPHSGRCASYRIKAADTPEFLTIGTCTCWKASALTSTQPVINSVEEAKREERERIGRVLDSRFREYMASGADSVHKTIASQVCAHFAAALHSKPEGND